MTITTRMAGLIRDERRRLLRDALGGSPTDRLRYAVERATRPFFTDLVVYGTVYHDETQVCARVEQIYDRLQRHSMRKLDEAFEWVEPGKDSCPISADNSEAPSI